MIDFKGLAHIGIITEDVEKSKKFYTENLGFTFENQTILNKPDGSWKILSFVRLDNLLIEFIQSSIIENNKVGNSSAVDHIAIEVESIDKVIEKLRNRGINFRTEDPIHLPELFDGVKIIFFEGPNGESLELFEKLS